MKKKFRFLPAIILFIVVFFVVKAIFKNPQGALSIIIPLIGLGVVILVHEFGHFIVARMCKMKTEVFSVGFGHTVLGFRRTEKGFKLRILPDFFPKDDDPDGLLSFTFGKCKAGTTEYRISLIPLGGYVKILGQEDIGTAGTNDDPNAFMNKSIWQRLAVISAGVVFNIILAIIIFMVVFSVGLKSQPPIIGSVMPGSPAAKAGLVAGDEVLEIAGETNLDFKDIRMAAALSDVNEPMLLKVLRNDGTVEEIAVTADKFAGSSMPAFGVGPADSLKIADIEDVNKLDKIGLKAGDKIIAVNGEPVKNSWQFYDTISKIKSASLELTVLRGNSSGEKLTRTVNFDFFLPFSSIAEPNSNEDIISFYSMVPRLMIPDPKGEAGKSKSPLRKMIEKITGVKFMAGDIIIDVAGVENPTYKELRDATKKYENLKMPVTVLRLKEDGQYHRVDILAMPKKNPDDGRIVLGIPIEFDLDQTVIAKTIDQKNFPALKIASGATITKVAGRDIENFRDIFRVVYQNIGKEVNIDFTDPNNNTAAVSFVADKDNFTAIAYTDIPLAPMTKIYKASNLTEALKMGVEKTVKFVLQTYTTIKAVAVGNVKANNLMGPIGMIGAGSKIIKRHDFMRYLWMQGLISACLAVMNFLPIPVVDGGHAVILIIEKIKGSPVNPKIIEAVSYVGFGLIMCLFVFITWNDLVKVILGKF